MIRINTGYKDSNGKIIFDDHVLENSRGVPFQIMLHKGEWVVYDESGDIPFTLEEMVTGEDVSVVGIATYS